MQGLQGQAHGVVQFLLLSKASHVAKSTSNTWGIAFSVMRGTTEPLVEGMDTEWARTQASNELQHEQK